MSWLTCHRLRGVCIYIYILYIYIYIYIFFLIHLAVYQHWMTLLISVYSNISRRSLPFIREHMCSKKQDEKVYPIQEHTKLNTHKNYISMYTVQYTRLMNTQCTYISTTFYCIIIFLLRCVFLLQNT